MLLRITARFLGAGTFSGHTPAGDLEWPPSPSRLLAALVAGAGAQRTDACTRGLCALESAAAPLVVAATGLSVGAKVPHFVARLNLSDPADVTLDPRKRKQLLGARLSSRTQMEVGLGKESTPFGDNSVVVDGVDYLVELPEETDPVLVSALDDAAGRVCYLGKATDTVVLSVYVVPTGEVEAAAGSHGYATALAESTARAVLVPDRWGEYTVPGWSSGLIAALDARHAAERQGKYLPHPAASAPEFHYRQALPSTADDAVVVAHLGAVLSGHRIGRLMDAVDIATRGISGGVAQVMIAPGGSERTRARASHVLVTAANVETRFDLMDAVTRVVFEMGLSVDWDPAPKMTRLYTGQSQVWTTAVPASAPGPARYAAAFLTADIARTTGVPADLIDVSVVRPAGDGTGVHPAATGSRLWDVTVVSKVPLAGPLHTGDTPSGILVHR